ncbi:hypothetical protein BGZ47_004350 [Haplosporangium gracile]|nr:hypothetical protein BGZ47_004350 [Haplosporangium gracile]
MASTTLTKNPFGLHELTQRLSKFVATKDAVPYALVSRIWADIFTSVIWFKIDFNTHPQFANLPSETIAKHGHRIRIANNVKSLSQVSALANSSVNKLRELHTRATASPSLHIRAYEVVLRNRASLQDLHLFANTSSFNRHESLANYVLTSAFVSLSVASPSDLSKITRLKIEQLCLTHDSLVEILRGCPKLYDLRLPYTDVVGVPTQSFQHTGVSFFASDFKNLFESNKVPRATAFSWWIVPVAGTHPSPLSYFPNLITLSVCNYTANTTIPSVEIKEAISQHCPRLTGFQLEDITGTIVFEFLTNIADAVSRLDDKVASVHICSQVIDHHLQLTLRKCSQLRVLDLHFYEMDMDDVEETKWACENLKTLRIRVKGLDTQEKILRAIALWRKGCWRQRRRNAGTLVAAEEEEEDETDMSIEARVARHLIKFHKLWWVWLGYQTWTPI